MISKLQQILGSINQIKNNSKAYDYAMHNLPPFTFDYGGPSQKRGDGGHQIL
jgi:hypothetical protein